MSNLHWIKMANLIFETEKKILAQDTFLPLKRNIDRMKTALEEAGIIMLNPLGEDYSETRTDVEATLLDTATSLKISEVIKPILYIIQEEKHLLLQKGIVIIE